MTNPFISIIVPIYNSSATLDMCLSSIENQTYKNFEVLLINDGSPDDSASKCEKYVARDSRFLYFYKENGGLSDARNAGLERVTGDYIMFVDSDDALSMYTLEYLSRTIAESGADIVSFNLTKEYDRIQTKPPYVYDAQRCYTKNVLERYFHKEVAACNRIYRAKTVEGIRFVRGQISEDVLYLFWCYQKANVLYEAEYEFYFYNQAVTGGITRSGLSIADNTSVEANRTMLDTCKEKFPELLELAQVQYMKSVFNIVNKGAIRGYRNEDAERFYHSVMPGYIRLLRKNLFLLLRAKTFSPNDKLQVLTLSCSYKLFLSLKKFYVKLK